MPSHSTSALLALAAVLAGGCIEPVACDLPPNAETGGAMNTWTCTGEVLDSGSMEGSDDPADAELACERSPYEGKTCCAFHLYGDGEWYVTNGEPVADGGVPDESEGGRAAGACIPAGSGSRARGRPTRAPPHAARARRSSCAGSPRGGPGSALCGSPALRR